eukprot:COSAG01_NODE_4537_length_4938_cov_369.479025_5_plen_103_part_00
MQCRQGQWWSLIGRTTESRLHLFSLDIDDRLNQPHCHCEYICIAQAQGLWRPRHWFQYYFQKLEGSKIRVPDLAHIMTKGMTINTPELASWLEDIVAVLLRE